MTVWYEEFKRVSFTLYLAALSIAVSLLVRQFLATGTVNTCICITPLDLALLILLLVDLFRSYLG